MRVINSSHLPRNYQDPSTCLDIQVDRELFDILSPHFLPIIQDKTFLGDYNPHIHGEWGDKYPNHPQFILKLENGDEVVIWTQHKEKS